jgi:MFS family permease
MTKTTPLSSRAVGVAFACTVGTAVSMTPMVYTVFGLFLIPLTTEFNWTRSSVSFVLLIVAVASALGYPVVGRLIDRHGARAVLLWGILLFAAAVASVALIGNSRAELYAAYAFIGIAGTIPSGVTFTKVIAGWFDHNRGLFLGIVGGLGNGLGAAISPLLVQAIIARHGWRGGYLGIGAVVLAIGFPVLLLLLRDAPANAPPAGAAPSTNGSAVRDDDMTLQQARSTSTFWIIMIAIALGAGCMTALFAHVVPMLIDRRVAIDQATLVLVTFSMVTAAWQVAVGFLLDRVPRPWIATPFFLAALAGLTMFTLSSSFTGLICSGVLMGLGLGTEYGVLPYFLSRYFGVRHYGSISGAIYGVIVLLQGFTPFLMDLVFDRTGSYRPAIFTIGAGLLAGAILILRLPRFRMRSRS